MLSLLFGHFDIWAHPAIIWGVVALIFGGCFVVFQGAFVTFLMNPRVLIALAVCGGLLAFVTLSHQNKALTAQVQQAAVVEQQKTDGAASVTFQSEGRKVAATHAAKLTAALTNAPQGHATDDVMDEIARQDADRASDGARAGGVR